MIFIGFKITQVLQKGNNAGIWLENVIATDETTTPAERATAERMKRGLDNNRTKIMEESLRDGDQIVSIDAPKDGSEGKT